MGVDPPHVGNDNLWMYGWTIEKEPATIDRCGYGGGIGTSSGASLWVHGCRWCGCFIFVSKEGASGDLHSILGLRLDLLMVASCSIFAFAMAASASSLEPPFSTLLGQLSTFTMCTLMPSGNCTATKPSSNNFILAVVFVVTHWCNLASRYQVSQPYLRYGVKGPNG